MRKSVKTRKIRGGTWLALAVMFLFCLLSGCGRAESGEEPGDGESGRKLKVAATLFPYYDFVRQVAGDQVELTVEDNGIGIPAHELPRIFDRGFTGSNGRSRGGSTGMGLYLARRLAAALEIELRAASEEGKGTRMTLLFPARENLSKL